MKNTILSVIAHIFCLVGVIFLFILPKNKYEWMRQMDSGLVTLPIDEGANSRFIVASLILAAVLVTQIWLIIKTKNKLQRLFPSIIILSATGLWLGKWY